MPGGILILLLAALGVVVVLGWLAVAWGFMPAPLDPTVVWVRDGRVRVQRGRVLTHQRDGLAEVFAAAGVTRGFIAVSGDGRVRFSRHIPQDLHQRLRNVLLN